MKLAPFESHRSQMDLQVATDTLASVASVAMLSRLSSLSSHFCVHCTAHKCSIGPTQTHCDTRTKATSASQTHNTYVIMFNLRLPFSFPFYCQSLLREQPKRKRKRKCQMRHKCRSNPTKPAKPTRRLKTRSSQFCALAVSIFCFAECVYFGLR